MVLYSIFIKWHYYNIPFELIISVIIFKVHYESIFKNIILPIIYGNIDNLNFGDVNIEWVKAQLRYPKKLFHFIFIELFIWTFCWNLTTHLYWKFTLQRYHSMHRMLNLNKFKVSYQVFKKIQNFISLGKKRVQRFIKQCLSNFFWHKFFTINVLCIKNIKYMNVTRIKCPIVM